MKIPAFLKRHTGRHSFLQNPPEAVNSPSKPDRRFGRGVLGKVGILFLIPLIFLAGGSLSLIIFAFAAMGKPIIPMVLRAGGPSAIFTALPPRRAVLGKSVVGKESRPLILEKYLKSYNSPLADHAQTLINAADKYNLDWRLLPAIAGQESTFCRTIPHNSHNCWGWAIHERYTKKFETWEGAIETVGKGLKEGYIDKGLTTPEQIMTRYCPRSITERGGSWATAVNYFLWEMDNF